MSVIVGYVPSPQGEAALQAAIGESLLRKVPLIVLNSSTGEGYGDERLVSADDAAAVGLRLSESGVEHEFLQFTRGRDAAEEMLDLIEERSPELVVIGIRRRSPIGKLIMGSTAQRILLGAPCPVLAVKA